MNDGSAVSDRNLPNNENDIVDSSLDEDRKAFFGFFWKMLRQKSLQCGR